MLDNMLFVARVTSWVARIALWLSVAGLVLMTAIIAAQVVFRYLLNDSLAWSEPAAVMIMGWFIFLGAAVGVREGYHLSFDVLLYFLPAKVCGWLHSISDCVVIGFGGCMMWFGTELAAKTANNALPSLGISGAFDFIPLIAGGVLLVIFSIERVVRRFAGLPTARFGETVLEE